MEGPADGHGLIGQGQENTSEMMKKRLKVPREEKDKKKKGGLKRAGGVEELPDLSRKDLLHLLGVMEGEVQVSPHRVPTLTLVQLWRHLVAETRCCS